MEVKARYLLMGFFLIAAIIGGFGFVYWLNATGGLGERTSYRIRFDTPVPGLLRGAAVLFNGIRVGEVTALGLNPAEPKQVIATVSVDARTPVRADTAIGLDFQGLTGVPAISLVGGTNAAGPPPDLLSADTAQSQDMMSAVRETVQHFDAILAENRDQLKRAIDNVTTFSDALARNSDRLDKIAAGLERMVGGSEAPAPGMVGLTAPAEFPRRAPPVGILIVDDPTALILFDTQRILVRSADGTRPAFEATRWSDNLPLLVQQVLVRTFENAGYDGVSRPQDGITADRHLLVEIRDFSIVEGPPPEALVELAAKIVGSDGALIAATDFRATVAVTAMDGPSAAGALDRAFGEVASRLVTWVFGEWAVGGDVPSPDETAGDQAPKQAE